MIEIEKSDTTDYSVQEEMPLQGDERKKVLKIIEKQNGHAMALALANRNITLKVVDLLKYAGHIQPSSMILTHLSHCMFPGNFEKFNEVYMQNLLESDYKDEEELVLAWEKKDYLAFTLGLLDKAGYVGFVVDTIEKQNALKVLFEQDEELCTFKDPRRFQDYHMIHYIKKELIDDLPAFYKALEENDAQTLKTILARNKDVIKRSAFPERQDEYGTSVGSIQILKTGGFISIKNRYNHTVAGCDQTFDSNPDNIIPGLSFALKLLFKVDFENLKLPVGIVASAEGQLVNYSLEKNNVYYNERCYMSGGIITPLTEDQIAVEDMIIDLKENKVFYPRTAFYHLVLDEELVTYNKRRRLSVTKDKKNKTLVVRIQDGGRNWRHFMTIKNARLIKLTLNHITSYYGGLSGCSELTDFEAKNLKKFNSCFDRWQKLMSVRCEQLEEIGSNTFETKGQIYAPKICDFDLNGFVTEHGCEPFKLNLNVARLICHELKGKKVSLKKEDPNLYSICADDVPIVTVACGGIERLHLPTIQYLVEGAITCLPEMKEFSAPNLKKIQRDNFRGCGKLDLLDCPNLAECDEDVIFAAKVIHAPKICSVNFYQAFEEAGVILPELTFNFVQMVGKELEGKKISVHKTKGKVSLKADGTTILCFDTFGKLTHLCLPTTKVIPKNTIVGRLNQSLKICIAPCVEEIQSGNFNSLFPKCGKYFRFDRLKKVDKSSLDKEIGRIYAPLIYPVNIYKAFKKKGIQLGTFYFGLICTLSQEMKGKKFSVVKTQEGVKTFLNGKEFLTFEKGVIEKINLPTARTISLLGIRLDYLQRQYLQMLSAPHVRTIKIEGGYKNLDAERICFPKLKCCPQEVQALVKERNQAPEVKPNRLGLWCILGALSKSLKIGQKLVLRNQHSARGLR